MTGAGAMSVEEQQPFILFGAYSWHNFLPPSDLRTHSVMSMFVNFQVPADSGFHSGERGDRHLGLYFNSGCRECRLASFYRFLCSTLGLAGLGVVQCCSVSVCSLLGDQPRLRRLQFPLT